MDDEVQDVVDGDAVAGRHDGGRLALLDDGRAYLSGEVSDVSFTGVSTDYLVRLAWGQEFTVTQPNDGTTRAQLGEQVTLAWDPRQAFVVGAD